MTVPHNVFISWSGHRSDRLSGAFEALARDVIQACVPFRSRAIDAGTRWNNELAAKLDAISIGVICLTPENQKSEWLAFEAGALAKKLDTACVIPYLLDLPPAQLHQVYSQFQFRNVDEQGTSEVLAAINKALGKPLAQTDLERQFSRCWPEYAAKVEAVRLEATEPIPPAKSTETLLSEMVSRMASIEQKLAQLREPSPFLVKRTPLSRTYRPELSLPNEQAQDEQSGDPPVPPLADREP